MNNIDYNKLMENEILGLKNKPTLLLHACCAPCSSSVLERLVKNFNITVFFYNPNMDTFEEYDKRKIEAINLIKELNKKFDYNIKINVLEYNHNEFLSEVMGLENEAEGKGRCYKCFMLRLKKTAEFAKANAYDYFTTTLSVSPYKNAKVLNEIGEKLQNEYNIKYLFSDFKKKDGYKRSIELSKEYNLYRQDYCGCEFSKKTQENLQKQ